MIDEANYTASQMGRALYYNLDPQTVLSGVTDSEVSQLLKGGRNTWCLPEKAKATLLESTGSYIDQAAARLEMLRKSIFDAAGVVLPDPERISGAQSGTSLELLAAPQIARIDALREDVGDAFARLLEQIVVALASPGLSPDKARVDVRDGRPNASAPLGGIVLAWGTHFPLTPADGRLPPTPQARPTRRARSAARQPRDTSPGSSAWRTSKPTKSSSPPTKSGRTSGSETTMRRCTGLPQWTTA